MYARIGRSRVDLAQLDMARKMLEGEIIPRIRQLPDAITGYWLEPVDGVAMAVIVFKTKEAAERPIPNAQPGDSPAPGVTVQSVEVRRVLANF